MAFTTIGWDGVGVIANCDSLSDSAGGSWAELGGGGISANTDNYLTPPASIGHVYASKSGFGYYTTAATYDFTASGNAEGQFIYIWVQIQSASAFDTLANNGFSFVCGTNTSNYRTFKLAGSGAGEDVPFQGAGWKLFVIDPTITGSIADTGTYNPATINMVGLWMDTIVSVRADTIFIDQVSIGKGLRVTGTGTLQELVDYCSDYSNRAWGVFQKRGSIAFAYGGLTVGDSASATVDTYLTDNGNVVEYGYTQFWDGSAWALTHPADYNKITLEKHASYVTDYTSVNSSWFGSSGAELSIAADAGATLSMTGGQLKEMVTYNTVPGQTLKSKVISLIDTLNLYSTADSCTIDNCGLVTVQTGGAMTGGAVTNCTSSTGVIAIDSPSEMAQLSGITFDSNNRCIEITAAGTYTFDGHQFGTNTIQVNNSSTGAVVINPTNGCNVSQAQCENTNGGSVTVNAVSYNWKFTLNPAITGYEWRVYEVTAVSSLAGAVEVEGEEVATTSSQTFTHSYSGQPLAVQIISDGYKEYIAYYNVTAKEYDETFNLDIETND